MITQATIMTKVQALEEEIESLSPEELAELQEWLAEREANAWDREIERDAASGKLDKLFEKSMADHRAGKSREI
jgi:preprotein translocase subunit SecA